MSDEAERTFHAQLTEQLAGVFEGAATRRKAWFAEHPDERPSPGDARSIITSYAYKNAMITGALNLVPGPWGLVAVLPEIVTVLRNQVAMVYDLGVAHDKETAMSRELLLGIVLSAGGAGSLGLLTVHGSKVLVKRSSLRVFQKLVAALGGRVTQRMLKAAIARWLPLVGAAAMAAWAKSSTEAIGRRATELLAKEIEVVADEADEAVGVEGEGEIAPQVARARIVVMAHLMRVDGELAPAEVAFVRAMATALLGEIEGLRLAVGLEAGELPGIETEVLAETAVAQGLLVDMVALAQRDGVVREEEVDLIRRVAEEVGLAPEVVEAALPGPPTA